MLLMKTFCFDFVGSFVEFIRLAELILFSSFFFLSPPGQSVKSTAFSLFADSPIIKNKLKMQTLK